MPSRVLRLYEVPSSPKDCGCVVGVVRTAALVYHKPLNFFDVLPYKSFRIAKPEAALAILPYDKG